MDLNRATIVGNCGTDPKYHSMQNGKRMAKFSVATSRKWKQNGELVEDVQWHNIIVFNPYLIEKVVEPMLQKGTRVFLEGEIKTRSYEKDGVTQYITEIIVPQIRGEILVLARGKDGDHPSSGGPSHEPDRGSTSASSSGSYAPPDEFDDDIPF